MTQYDVPLEWKSAKWWRNRPLEERIFHAAVPPRYKEFGSPLMSTAELLRGHEVGKSYLFTGKSGGGKTCTAVSMLMGLITLPPGHSGRFVDADTYVEMIKDSFATSDGNLSEEYPSPYAVKCIKGVFDVVLLDGLGNERKTDFALHEIGSLIRHRYDHNLTTIITSTMSLTDLISTYGDRVKSPVIAMKQVPCARQ